MRVHARIYLSEEDQVIQLCTMNVRGVVCVCVCVCTCGHGRALAYLSEEDEVFPEAASGLRERISFKVACQCVSVICKGSFDNTHCSCDDRARLTLHYGSFDSTYGSFDSTYGSFDDAPRTPRYSLKAYLYGIICVHMCGLLEHDIISAPLHIYIYIYIHAQKYSATAANMFLYVSICVGCRNIALYVSECRTICVGMSHYMCRLYVSTICVDYCVDMCACLGVVCACLGVVCACLGVVCACLGVVCACLGVGEQMPECVTFVLDFNTQRGQPFLLHLELNNMHTDTRTHAARTRTHRHMHMHRHTHMHTHTHTRTHTRTHTHMHTHKWTHTPIYLY